jgi:diaminopimelate epimerase
MGNPHAVAFVDDEETLATLDLTRPPEHDTETYPGGVNVEFVVRRGERHVAMRVHERGSGETRSCGTGTVATAVAAAHAEGRTTGTWEIAVPGGAVTVILDGTTSFLRGPAVLVAEGELRPDWLAAR